MQQGQQQPDIVEQVNAALHAAFDRPDVPLERMESAQQAEQQQQGQQAKEGQPQEGKQVQQLGGKDLRALDLQRDKLVEQVSICYLDPASTHLRTDTCILTVTQIVSGQVTRLGTWSLLARSLGDSV